MPHLDHIDSQLRSRVQRRTVATLSATAIFTGVGIAGTTAAGSLLIKEITGSGALSGLSQTFSVLGAAFMALPLARLTARGGRRWALISGWPPSGRPGWLREARLRMCR